MSRDNPSALRAPPGGWKRPVRLVLEELWRRELDERALDRIFLYLDEVARWGARMDLTAARSADELVDLSLADAAVLARVELERGRPTDTILDVGTGGGAPALPLLALLSSERAPLRACLVEPRTKRTAFLRSVVALLDWPEVSVERIRSDEKEDAAADVALARATLPPPAWLAEGARLARSAVWVLLAKEDAPRLDGWSVDHEEKYRLPLTGASRRALRYVPTRRE